MGRMHSNGKGIASSALPYKRTPPSGLKTTSSEVEEQVCKLARKGLPPSQIGIILRDSHGIAQVKSVTGNKILRVLKKNGACVCAVAGMHACRCARARVRSNLRGGCAHAPPHLRRPRARAP